MIRRRAIALLLAAFVALPASAYTIYLKDGSRIIARDKYVVEGDKAIITLENGTQTFLAAAEIDEERTAAANKANLGSALIFEDGEFVERTKPADPTPKRTTVSDLIARGDASVQAPERSAAEEATAAPARTATSIEAMQRLPMRDIELAASVKQAFVDRGIERAAIFQGTEQERPLVQIVAESEATVFNSLEQAAEVLLAVRDAHPDVEVMEIYLETSERERAGEFELTAAMAEAIQSEAIELPAFFIQHVRF